MSSAVFATVAGTVLGSIVVLLLTAIWKFANSVQRNTDEIARLATAVDNQHAKMMRRIKRLEIRYRQLEEKDHAGRTG